MNDDDLQAGCMLHPIAHSASGSVAACQGCGNLQLTLENISLRFEPAAFSELVSLLVVAERRLASDPSVRARQAVEPPTVVSPGALPGSSDPIH